MTFITFVFCLEKICCEDYQTHSQAYSDDSLSKPNYGA